MLTHTRTYTCTTYRPHVYWHKTMRKKLCKIVIVVIVFGRINILLGRPIHTEANQTNEKGKEKERRIFVHKMPEIRFVVSHIYMMQYIHIHISFYIIVNASRLKNVTISNLLHSWILLSSKNHSRKLIILLIKFIFICKSIQKI